MEANELAIRIRTILDDKKAREVEVIDVSGQTQLTERFVIATGTSTTHIRALADEVQFRLKTEDGILADHAEGYESCRWVLLDYKDVIVHVFHTEDRSYYHLERLWSRRPGRVRDDAPTGPAGE